jgi:hypothetical protein
MPEHGSPHRNLSVSVFFPPFFEIIITSRNNPYHSVIVAFENSINYSFSDFLPFHFFSGDDIVDFRISLRSEMGKIDYNFNYFILDIHIVFNLRKGKSAFCSSTKSPLYINLIPIDLNNNHPKWLSVVEISSGFS